MSLGTLAGSGLLDWLARECPLDETRLYASMRSGAEACSGMQHELTAWTDCYEAAQSGGITSLLHNREKATEFAPIQLLRDFLPFAAYGGITGREGARADSPSCVASRRAFFRLMRPPTQAWPSGQCRRWRRPRRRPTSCSGVSCFWRYRRRIRSGLSRGLRHLATSDWGSPR
jgi:hypothetical protein